MEVKNMKITVFGSTGKVGKEVIKQALGLKYSVKAFARRPQKIDFTHPDLTVVSGELIDLMALRTAIDGSDCVISLLGPSGKVHDNALSEGVKNIISIMESCGVKRLIQIATPSAADLNDRKDFAFGLMVGLVKLIFPNSYTEIVRIGETVRTSNLDWTLVRVPLLNEKPLTKNVRVGYLGQKIVKSALSRADLAWFMLEQTQNDEYSRKAPMISN
jgi:putative NADH-flavin reductase